MAPRYLLIFGLLACSLYAQKGDRPGEVQAPVSVKAPPAPALSVPEALATFKLAPGFHVEVVASDPLLYDPIAITFGADGRIWVVEMRSFMPNVDGTGENAPIGTIAVLEDTDGDGVMDKRTVYLDGLVMPRSVSLVGDGALVAEPPHLWYARDPKGTGHSTEKIEIANDYGGTTNPEHTANGLMWGLDNWIYSANHTVRFRYDGAGKFSRDGTITRGQWGISQDDTGRIYYNSNSDPLRVDLVPSEYSRRNPNINPVGTNIQMVPATLMVWPNRVTPGINRGYKSLNEEGKMYAVTAACGPVVYRGNLFPHEYEGNVFICEPAGNLIKRITLSEKDGGMIGSNAYEGTEFMTSTDERFRPVNLFNGPDGALYIVDMYRGVIQHRTYVTTYLRQQIEERHLEKPLGKGRIYRIVPDGAPPARERWAALTNLAKATPDELVAKLADGNGWTRDTAQRLLVERRAVGVAAGLRALASGGPPLGRLHALWTLDGLGLTTAEDVTRGLSDADPAVMGVSLRLAEHMIAAPAGEKVAAAALALAERPEPALRLQLALSLSEAHSAAADAVLRRLVTLYPKQPYLIEAVYSGLGGREETFVRDLIAEGGNSEAPPAAAVAVGTTAVLKSGDAARIAGVLALIAPGASPGWAQSAIIEGGRKFLPRSPEGKILLGALPAEPTPLIKFAAQSQNPEAAKARALVALLKWPGKPGMKTAAVAELSPADKALFEKGRLQFAQVCAACHQPNGQGLAGLAPPLVNSRWALGDDRVLARIVLCGKAQENLIMPPMKAFDDETLAGVLTYVRRSWGHEAAPVSPKVVAAARAAVAKRDEPWSDADLEDLQQDLAPTKSRAN